MKTSNNKESHYDEELFDLIDKFVLHLGFAVYGNHIDHFIQLFSSEFFSKIPQEEKFNSGIIVLGSIPNMQEQYLHHFIFNTDVSEKTLDDTSDENYWKRAGFDINRIKTIFSLRELKNELPDNNVEINKQPKV